MLVFEGLDRVGILQGQADVVQAVEQAVLAERVHLEAVLLAIRTGDGLCGEVNGQLIALGGLALLEELVDFFTPQAQVQRVQLRLKKSDQPVVAPVDPKLIKQAVLNLMLNACQAMPGGGELMLAVSRNGTDDALIDVIDTGPGVPPDVAERIFTAYYSTKKGGTGLGLPMSKRIAQEHGGDLSVRSEPGKGTCFDVIYPRMRRRKNRRARIRVRRFRAGMAKAFW